MLWVVGRLSFSPKDIIGSGSYGNVFKGQFERNVDVAVRRILKDDDGIRTTFESETLSRVDGHPNIVRYYITEQDDDFW